MAPLKNRYFANSFSLGQCWRTILKALAEISDNFQRNSLACGNLGVYWRHISFYSTDILAPNAGWLQGQLARLAHPLVQSCLSADVLSLKNELTFRHRASSI